MQGFRYEPTAVRHDRVVPRSRLTQLLNGRFSHRVTTIIGAAGYGKTTALALAIENNKLDPLGRDVWISAVTADANADHFLNGIATALDVAPSGDDDEAMTRIVDALWSAAPDDVALIIDDVHLIQGTESMSVLTELLASMPTNAHLVLGSRHPIDLAVARLRAHGELLEVTEETLALDDDEVGALLHRATGARAGSNPVATDADLPRHVATADLQMAAGLEASADFLWEEVLSSLEPDRLAHLRRAAVLDELDDEIVAAITDSSFDAAGLLRGVPLVDQIDQGGRRMHAILREALVQRLEPGERRKTLSIAADAERARRRYAAAAELYHESGDRISAMETGREYVLTPVVFQEIDSTMTIKRIVDEIDDQSPTALALEASRRFSGLDHQVIPQFHLAAAAARERDDVELEAAALNRILQAMLLDHQPGFDELVARATELATVSPTAASVAAHFRSIMCQLDGDLEGSLAELDGLTDLDPAREIVTHASRLCDLGRPEEVGIGIGPDQLATLPPGAELFIGLALWHRGETDPATAEAVGAMLLPGVLRRGLTHPSVSILATSALIALAAGDHALAERRITRAVELADAGVGASIVDLVTVARAGVTAVRSSDAEATKILDTMANDYFRKWPSRAQLMSLPMVYLLQPDLRGLLDSCDFGPSFTVALNAGQALVALRDHDDASGAAALPWTRTNVLRAHVLPTHFVELACAAHGAGVTAATDALQEMAHLPELLERTVATSGAPAVDVASDMLRAIPQAEPFHLHANVLGPVQLVRDGEGVTVGAFAKRPKVRELFAILLERDTLQRQELCELLWPDHDEEERALSSLRTTLSTLNDALEPGRAKGAPAFHLSVDGDAVSLDHRVTTNLTEFEELIDSAQADDNAGLPARALETYMRAANMYRGDYLQGIDTSWVVLPRLRIRALAVGAMCRIAELVAAKGEPEEAARWAARARQFDPLNERAGRLFVSALDASGDRSAARAAADELSATLDEAGLTADAATQRLLSRLA